MFVPVLHLVVELASLIYKGAKGHEFAASNDRLPFANNGGLGLAKAAPRSS